VSWPLTRHRLKGKEGRLTSRQQKANTSRTKGNFYDGPFKKKGDAGFDCGVGRQLEKETGRPCRNNRGYKRKKMVKLLLERRWKKGVCASPGKNSDAREAQKEKRFVGIPKGAESIWYGHADPGGERLVEQRDDLRISERRGWGSGGTTGALTWKKESRAALGGERQGKTALARAIGGRRPLESSGWYRKKAKECFASKHQALRKR